MEYNTFSIDFISPEIDTWMTILVAMLLKVIVN